MNEWKKRIEGVKDQVQQVRDEIHLKIHLGKADAKDEWSRLEKRRQELLDQAEALGDVMNDTAHKLSGTLEQALEELKEGYAKVRKTFKD